MNKKISELNEASELLEGDVLAIVQQGETKKIRAKLFCECGSADLSILDVRPGLYAGEIISIDQSIPDDFPEFKHVYTSDDRKFVFKKNTVVSVSSKLLLYLFDPDQYFKLILQIYDEEFNLIHNTSSESPPGTGTEQSYTLEVPVYLLTLGKSIYYIKTELHNLTLQEVDIEATGGAHTCYTADEGGLVLTASSSVVGAQFSWRVPEGTEDFFTDTNVQDLAVPFNFIVGEFTVTVTNPSNGRQNSKTVMVSDNTEPPICSLVFRVSNNTLSVVESAGASYTWQVYEMTALGWAIASGQGTSIIEITPGPVGSSALYSVAVRIVSSGCIRDCSLMLHQTSTGIVATSNNNIP